MSRPSLLARRLPLGLPLGLLGAMLSGCGPGGVAPIHPPGEKRRNLEPKLDTTTPLNLERLGRRLKIGDEAVIAQEVFPKPPKAYVFNDLPERLGGDFDGRGWESRDEGFGAILYSGRVALAMRQFYAIDAARYEELLDTIKTANRRVAPQQMNGENVDFWFWESTPQILMVLRRGVKQGSFDITIALGDASVMDALEMTPAKARSLIDRLASETKDPTKSSIKASTPRPSAPASTPDPGPENNAAPTGTVTSTNAG